MTLKSFSNYENVLKNIFVNLYQVNYEASDLLIYGMPQTGKSAFTFANAAIQLSKGKSCIFIVRNSIQDAMHLREKAIRFSKMLNEYNLQGFETVYAGDMSCNWRICKDTHQKELVDVSNSSHIKDALFSSEKKMVISLCNIHQLSALNHILQDNKEKLVLFVDEADSISYGIPDIPTNIEFNKLKNNSSQKIEITATPWDNFVGNENLENQNIIVLEPPRHYHSIRNSIIFKNLKYKINKFNGDLLEEDSNFINFYEEMSNERPFSSLDDFSHPIIVLHKTSTLCNHHKIFFEYFCKYYTNWVIIKEDSDSICMNSYILKNKNIVINGNKFKSSNGIFKFTNKIIIPHILQWLYDNGGASIFPHIVIKSGHFSGRSRSYVSTNGLWHLTHQYYNGAKTTPALIQEMRLVHDRPDSIPLKCYAHKDICQNIQRSAIMLDEQIDRLLREKNGLLVQTFVKSGKWNKNKLPSKKIKLLVGKLNGKFKVERVLNDDGWSLDMYKQIDKKINKYTIIDIEKFNNNSKVFNMLNDVLSILIDNCKLDEDIPIDWVNKELKNQDKYKNVSINNIRGNLWTNFRLNKNLLHTDDKNIYNELIYWKDTDGIFIRFNNLKQQI